MKRVGILLITLCMICTMLWACEETIPTGIHPPISSDDCEGMMYDEVAGQFEAAGFTNIEFEIIEDLITGWLTKDGEVEKVTLDGNDDFYTDDYFEESSAIVISYHTFPQDEETEAEETDSQIIETQPSETEAPKPETQAPETEAPKPETQAPETEAPKPETQAPETELPETTPVIVTPTIPDNSTFNIHFIDVGQADAALVECDGHYMLIDGGNKGDSKEEIAMSLCIKLKSHEVVEEIADDSVSNSENSVSKLNVEILFAKIISFINAQGFSCPECGRLKYMLLELSDCKEGIKSKIKSIAEDKKYRLLVICGENRTLFEFEVCLKRKQSPHLVEQRE